MPQLTERLESTIKTYLKAYETILPIKTDYEKVISHYEALKEAATDNGVNPINILAEVIEAGEITESLRKKLSAAEKSVEREKSILRGLMRYAPDIPVDYILAEFDVNSGSGKKRHYRIVFSSDTDDLEVEAMPVK